MHISKVVVLLIILAGCSLNAPEGDYQQINEWVHENIEYASMDGAQDAAVTIRTGEGDCLAQVILFLRLVEQQHGVRGELVVLNNGDSEGILHAVALVEGIYYDPTGGRVLPDVPADRIVEVWSYEYTAWLAVWN